MSPSKRSWCAISTACFVLACRLTSETDAPDVVQEIFLQVYRHVSTFRGGARFSTWPVPDRHQRRLMHRRARARRPAESLDQFLPHFNAAGRLEDTPDALRIVCRVDELLDRDVLATKVRAAIDGLPDLYRKRSCCAIWRKLSTADVAQVLGIEPATVRQRVHRARLVVREHTERVCRRQDLTEVVCRSGVELLMDYLKGVLTPDVRAAIERMSLDVRAASHSSRRTSKRRGSCALRPGSRCPPTSRLRAGGVAHRAWC
jgi:RNA polymerase sigma factor (sigma-70 family)